MIWYLAEVLELTRWSEPEDGDRSKGETSESMHWVRAFSCAALLRAAREPWNYGDGIATDESTIRLILSLRALPVDLTPQALKFLAWLLLNSEPEGSDGQVCAYGIGLLWFALQLGSGIADATLVALAEWIVAKEENVAARSKIFGTPWLFTASAYRQHPRGWGRLGAALQALDLTRHGEPVRVWVRLIGRELSTE